MPTQYKSKPYSVNLIKKNKSLNDGKQVSDGTIKDWLDNAPPWRKSPSKQTIKRQAPDLSEVSLRRGKTYVSSAHYNDNDDDNEDINEESQINFSLMLRRPLLVTGPPGCGKSTLAYHLAWFLGLGEPLRWEINSRTTLQNGLYSYDAVDHLRVIQERHQNKTTLGDKKSKIGEFITLGPLGTALLPTQLPRVLLVDELDKASYDLPNDLLHVFEEGVFKISELIRSGDKQNVIPYDPIKINERILVDQGKIQTFHHPVMIITSNQEREFPPAFLRRCVSLKLNVPKKEQMIDIIQAQLGDNYTDLPEDFIDGATDVILQSLFIEKKFGISKNHAKKGLQKRK